MDYEDFYDLATYANENWRGRFSHREVAGSAYNYKTEYDALGTDSPVIKSMLEVLEDDGSEEALDWIRRIKLETNLKQTKNCNTITQSERFTRMKYEMKLKLNKYQYLAVLDEALVIVTVDEDNNPVRYAIFDNKAEKENEE